MSAPLSLAYAHLVGKYVDMSRPPDEVEWGEARASYGPDLPADYRIGGAGLVAVVEDVPAGRLVGGVAVSVIFDYGMGFDVFADAQHEWRFRIFPDEETYKMFVHHKFPPLPERKRT